MKIIAESSSTRTEWMLVEGSDVKEHAYTEGLNPFFQSRREISHSIRLELPHQFYDFPMLWICIVEDDVVAVEDGLH